MSEVAVKVEDLSQVKKKMSFEIPWNNVKDELDHAYREISKKAKIKGFRPGKIPRKVLESYFKAEAEGEAVTNIINKYYWQALDDRGIVTLSRPEIEQEGFKNDTAYVFSATFETEPSIDPQGYIGIDLEKEKTIVSDDDLDKRLLEIRKMFATMEDVTEDRPSKMGDFVTIDFAGTLDGEALPELKAQDHLLELGSKRFIPGFEEQVAGMKRGETADIKVTFPDDYHEAKMAGREVIFSVTLNHLKAQKLPDIDDNFIKNFDKYETLDDLKNDVRKSLEDQCERQNALALKDRIVGVLLKANEFDAPPTLVERQIYYMISDTQKRMTSAGMDEKSALEMSFRMHDQFRADAEKSVKSFLLIKKIAEKEAIEVVPEDIEAHLKELAQMHHTDYEIVKSAFEGEERLDNLKSELIHKKVFDFIEGKANIIPVEKTGMDREAAQ
ncbi:MAG: trigger factor [Smithellaceae bacterium]